MKIGVQLDANPLNLRISGCSPQRSVVRTRHMIYDERLGLRGANMSFPIPV